MANTLIYSFLNPVQLFNPNLVRDERYLSKDFEDFAFCDTILPWEQRSCFKQIWSLADSVQLQLQCNLGPINLVLKRILDDSVIDTIPFAQGAESENEPGLFIYEINHALGIYDEEEFYFEVQIGADPTIYILRSGDQWMKEDPENTLLLEYKHYQFHEDMIFETGIFPQIRVQATKRFLGSRNKLTTYEDQVLNQSTLRAKKYRVWRLIVGETYGIPDYLEDILAGVVGCSDFRIDGKNYSLPENGDFEAKEVDLVPKKGWSVNLREKYNRSSRTYVDDTPIDAQIAVMVNVDSKGFGNSVSGSETAVIDII